MIRRTEPRDQGFTLVELIVYSAILIIVMGIAASVLIRITTAQRDAIAIAEANNLAQLTFKELEADLRNASVAEIADGGQLLVMQTRVATDADTYNWRCVGFYLSDTTGELRKNVSSTGTATLAALDAAESGSAETSTRNWSVVRDGFTVGNSSRAFGTVDGIVLVSRLVRMNLSVDTENGHQPVTFSKNVALRPQGNATPFCN